MGSEAGPTFRNLILDAGATGVELVASANPFAARTVLSTLSATEISDLIASAVAALVDASPGTLDTLNELAAALGDDANFSTTITAAIGAKYTLPGTGIPTTDLAAEVNSSLDLADSAVQPGDLAAVATSGSYNDLTDTPSGGGIDTLGTSGTDLNISGSTLNVPNASATARGVVTTGTQTIAGDKNFSGSTTTNILGITSAGYLALASKTYTRTDIAIRMNWGSGASGGIYGSNGNVGFAASSQFFFDAVNTRLCVPSGSGYAIGGTTSPAHHVMLASAASGEMQINNGTLGTFRDLKLRDATLSGLHCVGTYTVGTLPSAAANSGKEAQVTDAAAALSSATVGTAVAGGGANRVKVFSNGSNWVYA